MKQTAAQSKQELFIKFYPNLLAYGLTVEAAIIFAFLCTQHHHHAQQGGLTTKKGLGEQALFFCTAEQMERLTCIKTTAQAVAIKKLEKAGFIVRAVKKNGAGDPVRYFGITEKGKAAMPSFFAPVQKNKKRFGENEETVFAETAKTIRIDNKEQDKKEKKEKKHAEEPRASFFSEKAPFAQPTTEAANNQPNDPAGAALPKSSAKKVSQLTQPALDIFSKFWQSVGRNAVARNSKTEAAMEGILSQLVAKIGNEACTDEQLLSTWSQMLACAARIYREDKLNETLKKLREQIKFYCEEMLHPNLLNTQFDSFYKIVAAAGKIYANRAKSNNTTPTQQPTTRKDKEAAAEVRKDYTQIAQKVAQQRAAELQQQAQPKSLTAQPEKRNPAQAKPASKKSLREQLQTSLPQPLVGLVVPAVELPTAAVFAEQILKTYQFDPKSAEQYIANWLNKPCEISDRCELVSQTIRLLKEKCANCEIAESIATEFFSSIYANPQRSLVGLAKCAMNV